MNYNDTQKTAQWIREQVAHINPYKDKTHAAWYAVGFLSSVLAEAIAGDSRALTKFRLAVATKLKRD